MFLQFVPLLFPPELSEPSWCHIITSCPGPQGRVQRNWDDFWGRGTQILTATFTNVVKHIMVNVSLGRKVTPSVLDLKGMMMAGCHTQTQRYITLYGKAGVERLKHSFLMAIIVALVRKSWEVRGLKTKGMFC